LTAVISPSTRLSPAETAEAVAVEVVTAVVEAVMVVVVDVVKAEVVVTAVEAAVVMAVVVAVMEAAAVVATVVAVNVDTETVVQGTQGVVLAVAVTVVAGGIRVKDLSAMVCSVI
jgi:hypothetical protein